MSPQCSAGGCLIELAQQLAVIMIGKQMINNAQELLVPKLKAWWQKKQVKLPRKRERTRWEEDYQLIDSEGLFQEYLEMGKRKPGGQLETFRESKCGRVALLSL